MGGPPPPLPPKPPLVSSSPGRSEKLPTPSFARLLRRKNSRKSSRNQTPPLFPSSRNPSLTRPSPSIRTNPDAEPEPEPSSPKVTCIGQVRIRNKNKTRIQSERKRNNAAGPRETRCCFLDALPSPRSIWRGWSGGMLRFKRNALPPPPPSNDFKGIVFRKSEAEECDESPFVPPKNALILMRCRSAPHNRSSALAAGFSAESGKAAEAMERNESCEEGGEEEEDEEEEESRCPSSRPLFLKRCNSEPAKKEARLLPPPKGDGGILR